MATAEGPRIAGGPGFGAGGAEVVTPLRRAISRPMLTVFVIGDVLGAGIYALVGVIGAEVGGAIWSSFLLAGVLALFTATAYAELVTKYPQAAGAALYVHRAYRTPFFTFMVAFAVMSSGITSAATLATAFGGDYLKEFLDLPTVLVGLVFLVVIEAINFRGIKESIWLNMGLTAIEVTGLLLVVVIGGAFLFDGGGDFGRVMEFTADEAPLLAIVSGATLAFYALIGFEDSVNVAEETREPSRTYPPALFMGLGAAGVIYLLIAIIASAAVPTDTLAASSGPLLEVVRLGPFAVSTRLFSAIALFALTNGALINLIMASRLIYGMAAQGVIPRPLGRVHGGRRTPWVAILFTGALAAILIIIGSLERLADTTVLLLLLVFVCVNITVLVLRRDPVEHDHFRALTALPVIGAITCVGLIAKTAFDEPITFAYAGGLLALGVALWLLDRAFWGGEEEEIDPTKLLDEAP
ncbi:MAG: APC family permease [Acidimicrobiales bacterium]